MIPLAGAFLLSAWKTSSLRQSEAPGPANRVVKAIYTSSPLRRAGSRGVKNRAWIFSDAVKRISSTNVHCFYSYCRYSIPPSGHIRRSPPIGSCRGSLLPEVSGALLSTTTPHHLTGAEIYVAGDTFAVHRSGKVVWASS